MAGRRAKYRFSFPLAVATSVVLALSACTGSPPTSPPSSTPPQSGATPTPGAAASPTPAALAIRDVRADVARDPAAPDTIDAVVGADRDFALQVYRELIAGQPGNLFYSPYSISTALSMTYAGARQQTAAQLAAALGIATTDEDWHAGRNSIELALAGERPTPENRDPIKLEATNALFGQDRFPFEDGFLRLLAADYGAGMQAIDFTVDPDAARRLINAWVNDRTHDRIPTLLPQGSIDDLTRLVLVNAIYFKANWIYQFDPDVTDRQPFTRLDGSQVTVDEMHGHADTLYGEGDGWQAVRLRYAGGASMLLIVPDSGQFAAVESALDGGAVQALADSLSGAAVTLALPRWESESAIDLVPTLKSLGVQDLFDPGAADLSGITSAADLYVSAVIHQANITVDEYGTEAAAATAVGFGTTGGPGRSVTLTVDRPFIYLLTDDITGEVLFVGRVLDPTAG